MLPKDVLKYAEKVEDVEAEVLKALKKREEKKSAPPVSGFGPFSPPGLGQIVPADMIDWMQNSQQAAQNQLEQLRTQAQIMQQDARRRVADMHRDMERNLLGGGLL